MLLLLLAVLLLCYAVELVEGTSKTEDIDKRIKEGG